MKKLRFHYHMELAFSEPIREHVYTLKCLPKSTDTQCIMECAYQISPANHVTESTDSFGNRMLYGTAEEEHDLFVVDVTGRAIICQDDTGKLQSFQSAAYEAAECMSAEKDVSQNPDISIYRYQTSLTRPDAQMERLLQRCRKQTENIPECQIYDRMCIYMGIVHESIRYGKGVTNINTTAEEALTLGSGVCQDYAQIFISLCREDKIPARYVVGMLTGEGESHAWAEVYDGRKWLGFDPTNNVVAKDSHIKISHGRDYRDCSINRGVFTGQAKQVQSILVEVEPEV